MRFRFQLLAPALLATLALQGLAANSSLIQSPLTNTGADDDASGRVISKLGTKQSELLVQVARLAPSTAHEIEVGGIVEATFTTDKKGRATVKFKTSKPGKGPALDFDPRGKLLRVLAGDDSVLEASLSSVDEPAGAAMQERINLSSVAGAAGKATAEYRLDKKGRRTFKVELQRAGAGPFELFVGGQKRGDFTTVRGISRIKFGAGGDDAGVLPLDFDPRGQVVDVVQAGTILFSSELAAQANGVNVSTPKLSASAIPATGAAGSGHAEAKLRIDDRARKHFSVEIEDVPAGTYDLLVDGVDVADIVVQTIAGKTKGEVEFTSGDDDADELPLTFDPAGKTLTVSQGNTVFFGGPFNSTTGGGTGTPAPEPPSTLEESLASTGLDSDAHAGAGYEVDDRGRHKFSVEVEDVPAGSYTLTVAGVVRGTIRAAASSGDVKGELEFESKVEAGHRPLNFDPRGQLIEISSATGVFFSHLLGSGSSTGGGSATVTPFETTVPLLNAGVDGNATAFAQLKQKSTAKLSFEVEAEDLDLGSYDLLVGGTVRGTLTVVADGSGTRGQIEFESESGQLNFTVSGQEIAIQKAGVVYFSRVFPAQ